MSFTNTLVTKSPFELRYDSLTLARTHLMEEYYAECEFYRTAAERNVPAANTKVPVYPTPEAVMALAAKFKDFVDGKKV